MKAQVILQNILVEFLDQRNHRKCILVLLSVVENVCPFQEDFTLYHTMIMLDLFSIKISCSQTGESVLLISFSEVPFSQIQIKVHFIIELRIRHLIGRYFSDVDDFDLENELTVWRNELYLRLSLVSVF